jgi:aminocarboxymuconate-semialdehyde decarboxylase
MSTPGIIGAVRRIDAFAHVLPRPYLDRLEKHLAVSLDKERRRYYEAGVFTFDETLTDLDARRRKVETLGDYAQVLVLAVPPLEEVGPPETSAELARLANDEMAELVQRYPDRFAGFAASLPLNDVEASLEEAERALTTLGALGVQVFTNVNGVPIDEPRFDPLLAHVETLQRMVWLHPTRSERWPDYPTERTSNYGLWWSLGWPYETAAALSRLVYSGQMERHPDLRVLAHHGGGMVPHFSARLAMGPGARQTRDTLPRPPLEYFRRFYADTAMFGAAHAVRCVVEFFGTDHVLFGTDMPLGGPDVIESTVADLESIGLSESDLGLVYSGNARRLLGVL